MKVSAETMGRVQQIDALEDSAAGVVPTLGSRGARAGSAWPGKVAEDAPPRAAETAAAQAAREASQRRRVRLEWLRANGATGVLMLDTRTYGAMEIVFARLLSVMGGDWRDVTLDNLVSDNDLVQSAFASMVGAYMNMQRAATGVVSASGAARAHHNAVLLQHTRWFLLRTSYDRAQRRLVPRSADGSRLRAFDYPAADRWRAAGAGGPPAAPELAPWHPGAAGAQAGFW